MDKHVAMETYIGRSQPLIVIGKRGDNITMMIDQITKN
jgi:ribosomal protein S3